uniref:Endonuclease n=1 Tax=Strigamia maritima TaxID=126957 RepID=T1JFH6_STRMM
MSNSESLTCFNCHKRGHFIRDCPEWKVQEALLLENNRRKLSEKSLEAATAYSLSLEGHSVMSDSGVSSSDSKVRLRSITYYNCGIRGHYARDCTKPKVPRSQQPQQGQPQQQRRGRGRGRRRSGLQAPSVPAEAHKPQSAWFANAPGEPTVPKSPQVCSASVDVTSTAWYLDSCASHHVCGNREMFCEFEELQPMRLELGEGSSSITGRGTIELIVQVQGAPHEIKLLNVYFVKNFSGIELHQKVSNAICDNCELSKSTRAGFKSESLLVASEPLELLHMDLWGPCPVPSLGEAKYLLCVVDDATRYTWIFPLRSKDQVFETYKKFHARIERSTGKKIKAIRTDRGGEFTSSEFEQFLTSLGVSIQITNAYSPEMNGVAERVNRTVLNSIRAMLLSAGLPKPLWAELAITLVYLKNRYPHSRLGNKISYVLFWKRPVSLAHLKIPGSLAYVHVPKPSRSDKLESRAWKGVMLGYAITRGFRIWDPITGDVYESKHVKFDETRLYKDVVRTHVGDSHFQTDSDQSTYRSSPNGSSDSEDEVPPPIAPRPARTLSASPPVAPTTVPPPAAQKFATQHFPPFVSTRKKDFSIATTPLRPTRVAHRVPVPHKPDWEREEVQRQSGATKGQWDVYYYAPGLHTALRSRPDIKAYCETNLKVKYKAEEYDFNPAHAVDSDSDDDVEQPRDAEVEPELMVLASLPNW